MIRYLISLLSLISLAAYGATPDAFTLRTSSFSKQSPLPVIYTCDGKNISPEFDWVGVPEKAKTLVFLMADLDSPTLFYHWVLYNIPKAILSLPEGIQKLPPGIIAAKNTWGSTDYRGPCPPKGETHRYNFTLYAIDNELKLPADADGKTVFAAIQNHIVGQASLISTYNH